MMDAELRKLYSNGWAKKLASAEPFDLDVAGLRAVAEAAWDEGKAMGIVMLTAKPGTYDSAILDNPYREGTP